MLTSANDYISYLQDAIIVSYQQTILLAYQLKIIRVVLQHSKQLIE